VGLASSVPDAPGGPSTPATVSFSGRGRWVGQPPAALSAVPLSRHRAVRELSVPLRTSAEAGWRGSLASGVPPAAGGLPLPAAVSCSRRGRWVGQPPAALSVVPPSRHRAGPRAAHPVADSWSRTTSASFLPRWPHHHPAHRTPSAAIAAKPTPHSITRWTGSANVYSGIDASLIRSTPSEISAAGPTTYYLAKTGQITRTSASPTHWQWISSHLPLRVIWPG